MLIDYEITVSGKAKCYLVGKHTFEANINQVVFPSNRNFP